jgi:transcriptional regulator with XRE-family HTH domain
MTQTELAERAGVSVSLIAKLEQGSKQHAKITSLHKIAAALDVDVGALLTRPATIEAVDDGGGILAVQAARAYVITGQRPPSSSSPTRQATVPR